MSIFKASQVICILIITHLVSCPWETEGKLGGEIWVECTARETGMSWWLLQRKHKQIPCQRSRTASLSSCCVCCPWPGLPRSARFVRCKRAKDHGRSEALCSQTARTPAGLSLSVTDYGLSPASCLYASASQQGLAEHLLEPSLHARWLEGSNQVVMWLPLGSELLLCCLPFLQEPKFRLVKW